MLIKVDVNLFIERDHIVIVHVDKAYVGLSLSNGEKIKVLSTPNLLMALGINKPKEKGRDRPLGEHDDAQNY